MKRRKKATKRKESNIFMHIEKVLTERNRGFCATGRRPPAVLVAGQEVMDDECDTLHKKKGWV